MREKKKKKWFGHQGKRMKEEELSFISGGSPEVSCVGAECDCGGKMMLLENYGDGTGLYKCRECGKIKTGSAPVS